MSPEEHYRPELDACTEKRIDMEGHLIQEKKKLEQAVKELQKMNTFMVDREARMVALRKELAKYKKTS